MLLLILVPIGCGGADATNADSGQGNSSKAAPLQAIVTSPSTGGVNSAKTSKSESQVDELPDSPQGLETGSSSSMSIRTQPTQKSAVSKETSVEKLGMSASPKNRNVVQSKAAGDDGSTANTSADGRTNVVTDPDIANSSSQDAATAEQTPVEKRFRIPSVRTTNDGYKPERRLGPSEIVKVDWDRCQAAGLRYVQSKHLTLITDHPVDQTIDEFGNVFDQAVPQWIEFFSADARRFKAWHVTCFMIVDIGKFQAAKLLPPANLLPGGKLPPGGWEYGNQIWVNRHPGTYYNRHMLLHEGTHAFSYYNFGNLGPIWLSEGVAEHLAVHRWNEDKLVLAARVTDKDELAYWGRVKLIQDAYKTGIPKSLQEVMSLPQSAFPQTEAYAWSWAAVNMLDTHPILKADFRNSLKRLGSNDSNSISQKLMKQSSLTADQLEAQWQVMTKEIEYGYDMQRAAIDWKEAKVLTSPSQSLRMPADGAWHSTGFKLPKGSWKIESSGSYQVAVEDSQAWIAQPEGITVKYIHGQPIGQLQYALVGQKAFFQGMTELSNAQPVGQSVEFQASGEALFLRINDHPSHLDDNEGEVEVTIQKNLDR